MLTLVVITFFAAMVNGALGYGFSSITVPVALLFLTNRVLNPALVLVEVFLNAYVLYVNRKSFGGVWKKLRMILIGLVPTIIIGSYLLNSINTSWVKFITYGTLLPILFLQVAGYRRPIKIDGAVGAAFGGALGFLYSLTTISGPPLALLFNNDGMVKGDFRAALGVVRVFESTITAIAYFSLGLITWESIEIFKSIIPSVLIGIPLGAFLIRKLDADVFRRVCMTVDVLLVSFGLSRVVQDLRLIEGPAAYSILVACAILDSFLLYQFFSIREKDFSLKSKTIFTEEFPVASKTKRSHIAPQRHVDPDGPSLP